MGHTPIDIGTSKQLFFDTQFFGSKRGISLVANRPYQEPDPILVADKPWESGGIGCYHTAMLENGVFRLWYDVMLKPDTPGRFNRQLCYAESVDGTHWNKPDLGLISFAGSKHNNIVSPPSGTQSQQGATVFRDDNAPKNERYKAWTKLNPPPRQSKRTRAGGLRALVSPDGLRWKFLEEGYPLANGSAADSQNIPFWDDELERYVAFVRMKNFPRGRDRTCWVGRMTSKDFRTWTQARTVFRADERDDAMPLPSGMEAFQPMLDFYTPGGMKYPGAPSSYIMLPTAYHHWDRGRFPSTIDVQFLSSRDGLHWHRPAPREPYLSLGMDGGPSSGMLFANPWPLIVGDEVWIYYAGTSRFHLDYGNDLARTGLFRARLRLDGFLSADAPDSGATFTTPPLKFAGRQLELNVDTGGGGWLEVEIQGSNGRALAGLSRRDCDVTRGNSTRKIITWKGSPDCSAAAHQAVRLRFAMRSTKLYAFQFVNP
jgi:hypothetical protein